jgi:hypothetical protein
MRFSCTYQLQSIIQCDGRQRKLEVTIIRAAIKAEDDACRADLSRLIAFLETAGEKWTDPQLDDYRIWELDAPVFDGVQGEDIRQRWKRIH